MFSIQEFHPSRVSKHTIQQDLMLFELDAMGGWVIPWPSTAHIQVYVMGKDMGPPLRTLTFHIPPHPNKHAI